MTPEHQPEGQPAKKGTFVKNLGQIAWRLYASASLVAAPIAVATAAEVFSGGAISRAVSRTINNFISPLPPKPDKPDFLVSEEGKRLWPSDYSLHSSLKQTIEAYESWQEFNQDSLQAMLELPQPEQVFKTFEQVNMNFIQEGAGIMQTAWLLGLTFDQVQIDSAQKHLWFNDMQFDLGNRFDRQLASTFLQTKIKLIDNNLLQTSVQEYVSSFQPPRELPIEAEQLSEDLEYLNWLKAHLPQIELQNDSIAFISRTEMVKIARLMQALDLMGLNVTESINWCGAFCVENGQARGTANPLAGKTNLDPEAGAQALAHEIAHLKFIHLLPKFTLIRGTIGQAKDEQRLQYITNYAMKVTWEDFADTFAYYVMRGDYFRSLLAELEAQDPQSYSVLKQKYDFIKREVAKGLEFTDSGKIRSIPKEQVQQEFAGILWNPKSRTLTVHPNTEAWPDKRTFTQNIPVLSSDREIQMLAVQVEIRPKNESAKGYQPPRYNVKISNPLLAERIELLPLMGDERISVEEVSPESVKELKVKGGWRTIQITPHQLKSDQLDELSFGLEGLTPIKKGQQRDVLDRIPEDIWSPKPPLFYVDKVTIFDEEPVITLDESGHENIAWWVDYVERFRSGEVLRYEALLPEGYIGEEVDPK